MVKKAFKFLSMFPIFLFIGTGVLLSTDILQPSMLKNPSQHLDMIALSLLIGIAPIFLATNAINSILTKSKNHKSAMAISMAIIFMISEIVYSYASVKGFFYDENVPIIKIIGILFIPLTYSMYYFISLFYDYDPKSNKEYEDILVERENLIKEIKLVGSQFLLAENNN